MSGERARDTYVTLTWCSKPQPTLDRVTALREANIYEPQRYRHLVSPALMSIGSDATPAAGSSQARPWSSIAVRSTRCWRSRSDCPCRQARARPFGGSAFRSQPLRIRSGAFVPRRQRLPFPRPNITASADCCIAATFSVVMRRHSVGEHVPSWSIIRLQDAIINSAVISGSAHLRRGVSFAMSGRLHRLLGWDTGGDEAAAVNLYR